jgi:hypothetical protein
MKMLFSEVYGNYYNAIANILDSAIDNPINQTEIRKIVEEKAFAESILTIPDEIIDTGKWSLLDEEGRAIITRETYMPPTLLQKRWLKSLMMDPRIALFNPDTKGLEDIEPLFNPEDFVFYDQFLDGDPYSEDNYIKIFRMILSAIKNQLSVRVLYTLKNEEKKWIACNPIRLEYSLRDDKFRLISASRAKIKTINLAKIEECEIGDKYEENELTTELHDKRIVELLLKDERQALDRVMMQFSIYEKVTEKVDEDLYRFVLKYEAEDEIDILIRVLSFGPNLKVVGPESFVKQIRNRLKMQKSCGQ